MKKENSRRSKNSLEQEPREKRGSFPFINAPLHSGKSRNASLRRYSDDKARTLYVLTFVGRNDLSSRRRQRTGRDGDARRNDHRFRRGSDSKYPRLDYQPGHWSGNKYDQQ